jgi:hypothetical protein
MKLHYNLDGTTITITLYRGENFSDPEKEIISETTFDAAECPDTLADGETSKTLAGYGLLKLLQDRTSQEKDPQAKVALMGDYFNDFFTQGLWKKPAERKPAAPRTSRRTISASLAEAIARLKGITALEAESALKALSKDDFTAISQNPRVVELVKEIEKELESSTDNDLTDLI